MKIPITNGLDVEVCDAKAFKVMNSVPKKYLYIGIITLAIVLLLAFGIFSYPIERSYHTKVSINSETILSADDILFDVKIPSKAATLIKIGDIKYLQLENFEKIPIKAVRISSTSENNKVVKFSFSEKDKIIGKSQPLKGSIKFNLPKINLAQLLMK